MSISIPFALLDGLAGSVLRYLSPTAPLNPSRTAFSGSKLCILSPHALSDGLSGSISAFPSPNTAPVPHSKALPGSKSPFLSPHALSRCRLLGLQVRSRSAQHSVLSRTAASRCHSSPSAPLVPPQGPAEPSLAARTSISYYSPTRSQYRPRFQSGTTIKKKELPKDDSPNRRRSAAHQGAQFIQ